MQRSIVCLLVLLPMYGCEKPSVTAGDDALAHTSPEVVSMPPGAAAPSTEPAPGISDEPRPEPANTRTRCQFLNGHVSYYDQSGSEVRRVRTSVVSFGRTMPESPVWVCYESTRALDPHRHCQGRQGRSEWGYCEINGEYMSPACVEGEMLRSSEGIYHVVCGQQVAVDANGSGNFQPENSLVADYVVVGAQGSGPHR